MDLVPRLVTVKTRTRIYEVMCWFDGRVACNDESFFEDLEKRRAKMFKKVSRRQRTVIRRTEAEKRRTVEQGQERGGRRFHGGMQHGRWRS